MKKRLVQQTLNLVLTTALCTTSYAVENIRNITVIGIGRLGLCTALSFERAGYNVLGVDQSLDYINNINNKTFNSPEPNLNKYLQKSTNFHATTSLDEGLNFADMYFIVVPTPTGKEEAYDHSILNGLLRDINQRKITNKHIVICCTVFPGYIHNKAHELLQDCSNITISYNPEFIAQGNIFAGFESPDMILIGEGSKEVGDILEHLYKTMCSNQPKICRMSPESAEITKLSVNCFVTTKIAFANMIGDIADSTPGADKFDILNAVGKDSRVGSKYLKPGYGFGGPCFPRDNRALGTYASQIGIEPLIPLATDQANKNHAQFMTQQFLDQQNHSYYVFEDVNYKDNCNVVILEESQKLAVAFKLAKANKKVIIRDRQVVLDQIREQYGDLFIYEVV